ncbi:MAG: PDZ domain-containing protein, partial [Gemmatimonadetes bacterium]|nr:PDZ domain-containing protein [Gemmatimonadota bacterium]
MKRMRIWVVMPLAVGFGPVLMSPASVEAQVRGRAADACPAGMEEGTLGISGLDCVGECTLTIRNEGAERTWSFSTEPRIIGIARGGPAEGTLETGDFLVAIDGILITTREGGRRYANLQPGERVSVRYRRDGRVREGTVRVGSRCRDVSEPVGAAARVAPLPPVPDDPRSVGVAVVAPRVRVAPDRARTAVSGAERATGLAIAPVARPTQTGLLAGSTPTGRLGIGFRCTECGTRADEETEENVWFFSGPLEVTAVNVGGPAEEAGIKRGDLIKAIDGKSIDTDEGGLTFTRITPGESVRLTVVRRNGAEEDVSLVPDEAGPVGAPGAPSRVDAREPRRAAGVA